MNRTATLSSKATREISEAQTWYESARDGLGKEFLSEVLVGMSKVMDQPEGYRTLKPHIRECATNRFPFLIVYTVATDSIDILAVFHTSRNPDKKLQAPE